MNLLAPRWRGLAILLLLVGALRSFAAVPTDDEARATYREILGQVQRTRIDANLRQIVGFGSRIAGSVAEARTFDLAEARMRRLGLKNVRREPFGVTIPDPDARGKVTWVGGTVDVWPMWPNLVRTATCDVEGPLLYGGDGRLSTLKGKEIHGAIVVLEFNSKARWRDMARLGARAVVFIQPEDTSRDEAEEKFASVPVDVPRFYLPLKSAGPFLDATFRGERARLACQQRWIVRQSMNLVGELPGEDAAVAKEPIALMAYTDAPAVIPGLAPGAESATGAAALLELMEVAAQRPRRRPLHFVFSGAHALGLQGVREFTERRLRQNDPAYLLALTLDFSSGSSTLGSYSRGWYYEYRNETTDPVRSMSRMFRAHADRLAPLFNAPQARLVLTDATNDSDSRTWKNNIPGKFAFDCEPMLLAGMNALTLATIEDGRLRVETPFDTLDRVNVANVHRQTQATACLLHRVLNDTSDKGEPSDYKVPLDLRKPERMRLVGGFSTLDGRVVIYDPAKSFLPDTRVPNSLATVLGRQKTMMGVRGDLVQATGEDAAYAFHGMAPVNAYFNWSGYPTTRLAAFRLDDATGRIDYAPSWGIFGDTAYPIDFELRVGRRTSPIVVFPCVSVNLFGLVDPQELKALQRVRVLDARTDAPPNDYGLFSPRTDQRLSADIEDVQVFFATPGQRYKLLASSGLGEVRLILTNSRLGDEGGTGYNAPKSAAEGEATFPDLALASARDIVAINGTRLARFKKYRIISEGVSKLQQQAEAELRLAETARAARDWEGMDRHARAAWGYALRAHPVIMTTANDVVNGVVFYLFLLIPFSYFLERLFFGYTALTRQLSASIGIFIGAFVLLRLIHPAFEIVQNPVMIFVAFVMGALSLIVISFILGKFETSLRNVKAQSTGVHEVDVRRSSVAMAAFNLGVSNMRRRRARTVLTTLTLVVMTFIVLSFTSIVSDLSLNELPSETPARYAGILMRNPGLEPMQTATYRETLNEFTGRGYVVRRAHYYGADIGDTGVLTLQRADRNAEVRAMVGFDPEEQFVLRPQDALLPGGRWFRPNERDVMILPKPLADQLKIEANEVGKATVRFAGVEYTVIGIADPGVLRGLRDLDGDGIMPADFTLSRQYQEASNSSTRAFRSYLRLDPANCFLVPTETAIGLGGDIRTIAVGFGDPAQTRKSLTAVMPRLRMNLYASVPTDRPRTEDSNGLEVRQFSVFQASKGSGAGLVVVQLLIAAVFVLNTMIASVFERTREIGIFSSIGLAPNHIATLFFAESLVYGVLGAVFGYYVAQGTAKAIVATGALPGLTLNFSSSSAVMSAVIVMGVVLLSTIYPARRAAQIAAPARNDQVFETEPDGDRWELPLPFSIGADEAAPMVAFLSEWLYAYQGYVIGEFVTKDTHVVVQGEPERPTYVVTATTWLAPYDLGVSQSLRLEVAPSFIPGVYKLDLILDRLAGDPENWPVVNQRFLGSLRRQFLTWRTLDRGQRSRYVAIADGGFTTHISDTPPSAEPESQPEPAGV